MLLAVVDDNGSAVLAQVEFGIALQLDACGMVLAEVHQDF